MPPRRIIHATPFVAVGDAREAAVEPAEPRVCVLVLFLSTIAHRLGVSVSATAGITTAIEMVTANWR